jgi:hypothetical protein
MASAFVYVILDQASISAMVTPETAKALEMLRDGQFQDSEAAQDTSVPVAAPQGTGTATNSFTLSLWVAAINKTNSPFLTTATPPPAYTQSDALLRCSFGWVAGCDGRAAAGELGIRYLLVEERFPYYNQYAPGNYMAPDNQWEVTARTEWLKPIYSAGTTRLYEVGHWHHGQTYDEFEGGRLPILRGCQPNTVMKFEDGLWKCAPSHAIKQPAPQGH